MAFLLEGHQAWAESLAQVFLTGSLSEAPYSLCKWASYLGIIHLLVLSGSQVAFFSRVTRSFWAPIFRKIFKIDERLQRIFIAIFIFSWVASFHFPPPLTRALLFEIVHLYSPRVVFSSLAWRLLLIQILIFPNQLHDTGFYLSWTSFLLVSILAKLKLDRLKKNILATLFCTLLIYFSLGQPMPDLRQWGWIIVANLTLVWVAEHLWFPVLAGFHFFSFLGLSFGILSSSESTGVGSKIMTGLIEPFLLPLRP